MPTSSPLHDQSNAVADVNATAEAKQLLDGILNWSLPAPTGDEDACTD